MSIYYQFSSNHYKNLYQRSLYIISKSYMISKFSIKKLMIFFGMSRNFQITDFFSCPTSSLELFVYQINRKLYGDSNISEGNVHPNQENLIRSDGNFLVVWILTHFSRNASRGYKTNEWIYHPKRVCNIVFFSYPPQDSWLCIYYESMLLTWNSLHAGLHPKIFVSQSQC